MMGSNKDKALKKFKIKENKAWAKHLHQKDLEFVKMYINLYDRLYKRFQIEFSSILSLESKCDFLQELIDDIIKANHNMKHNYNISELAEESEKELRGLLRFFDNEIQNLYFENTTVKKPEEDMAWFKAGLCFAEGKMDKYESNGVMSLDWSAPKIAKELNLPKCEKYFLASLNNYQSSKNIFNSINRIEKIIQYCKEKNIVVSESFISRYNEIKDKSIYLKR